MVLAKLLVGAVIAMCCVAAHPQVGSTVEKLLGSLTDDGARAAGRAGQHSDDIARRSKGGVAVSDDLMEGLSERDVQQLNELARDFSLTRGSDFDVDSAIIIAATALLKKKGDALRTISYSDEFANIRIKVPATHAEFDDTLRDLAHWRLNETFGQPFDVADLRVVPLGMADDAANSTKEVSRYTRLLPDGIRDEVGPLSRMHLIGDTRSDITRALRPYKNKTLVLVGHIPNGTAEFVVFAGQIKHKLSISHWTDAAKEVGVNLIPIGCNSGRFADFGADALINSADVLNRLLQVYAMKPANVGTFFKHLTGDDLALTINALDVQLFTNAAEITSRATDGLVGRVSLDGIWLAGRELFRHTTPIQSALSPSYDACFAVENASQFDFCATRVEVQIDEYKAKIASEADREYKAKRLQDLPILIENATQQHDRALRASVGFLLLYLFVWGATSFLVPHGRIVSRREREEGKLSWRAVFGREMLMLSIKETCNEVRNFFPSLVRSIKLIFTESSDRGTALLVSLLFYLPALLGLPLLVLILADAFQWTWFWLWLLLPVSIPCMFMGMLMLDAIDEESTALIIGSAAFFVWIVCGYGLYETYSGLPNSLRNLLEISKEYEMLRADYKNPSS